MTIAALLSSAATFPQNGGAVLMRPDEAQGYLVLNKVDNPDVSSWVVTLKERTYSAQGTPTDVQREKVTLKDNINFWCVPNTYLNSQSVFFAEVVG